MDVLTASKNHQEKSSYPGDIVSILSESTFNYLHLATSGAWLHSFFTISGRNQWKIKRKIDVFATSKNHREKSKCPGDIQRGVYESLFHYL